MQRIIHIPLNESSMLNLLAQEIEHPGAILNKIQADFRLHVDEWWGTWDDCHIKAEPFQRPSGLKGITITAVLKEKA
ncbi:MAG: hypothetical protein ACK52I_13380 [Pseudomonadota bacterium]|jgi:hypothetical protein